MTLLSVFTILRWIMFIDIRKTAEGHSSAEVMLSFPEELQDAGKVVGEFPATIAVSRYDKYIFVKVAYQGEVEVINAKHACAYE